jgi:hypothetical protein
MGELLHLIIENTRPPQSESMENAQKNPYACATCSATFSRTNDLATHARIHNAINSFLCRYCDLSFSWQSDLETHQHVAHGIRNTTVGDTIGRDKELHESEHTNRAQNEPVKRSDSSDDSINQVFHEKGSGTDRNAASDQVETAGPEQPYSTLLRHQATLDEAALPRDAQSVRTPSGLPPPISTSPPRLDQPPDLLPQSRPLTKPGSFTITTSLTQKQIRLPRTFNIKLPFRSRSRSRSKSPTRHVSPPERAPPSRTMASRLSSVGAAVASIPKVPASPTATIETHVPRAPPSYPNIPPQNRPSFPNSMGLRSSSGPDATTKRLRYTEGRSSVNHCGRHANDWLFEGFSVRETVRQLKEAERGEEPTAPTRSSRSTVSNSMVSSKDDYTKSGEENISQ